MANTLLYPAVGGAPGSPIQRDPAQAPDRVNNGDATSEKGSVGASGDLVPLAHMSLPLLGVGEVRYKGKIISAVEGLNTYAFAINPEDHQPSGTTNFSRIDNASLNVVLTSAMNSVDATIKVYALSYNILRAASGLAGLAFAS